MTITELTVSLSTSTYLWRLSLALMLGLGGAQGLVAQDADSTTVASSGPPAAALAAAARTISAAELARHIAALTAAAAPDSVHPAASHADSLRQAGRSGAADTGHQARAREGQAAERTAAYIAEQWQQFGLVPMLPPQRGMAEPMAPGPWVQRATAPGERRLRYAETYLYLSTARPSSLPPVLNERGDKPLPGWEPLVPFSTGAHFVPEAGRPIVRETFVRFMTEDPGDYMVGSGRTLLVAGPHSVATLRALGPNTFADAVVFYAPPAGLDSATRRAVLTELYSTSRGVIVLSDADSATFAREREAAQREPVTVVDHYLLHTLAERRTWSWVAAIRPAAVVSHFWVIAGIEPAELRQASMPVVRELPGTAAWLNVGLEKDAPPAAAPVAGTGQSGARSVVGNGADSAGTVPMTYPYVLGFLEGADSVLKRQTVVVAANLGAPSAQAAELAGLVLLARAFSQPEVRPRRSVLFVAAGGAPPVNAGSWLVADQAASRGAVMALTLEHLEANAGSTPADGARAGGPADGMLVVDGGADVVLPRSPAWVAATHPELGLQVADTGTIFRPETAALAFAAHLVPGARLSVGDAEPMVEAKVQALRFAWYLVAALANTSSMPQWTGAGRRHYLEMRR